MVTLFKSVPPFFFYQNFNDRYRSFTCILTDTVLYSMFMLMSVTYFEHLDVIVLTTRSSVHEELIVARIWVSPKLIFKLHLFLDIRLRSM
jgi:hypothetical protein